MVLCPRWTALHRPWLRWWLRPGLRWLRPGLRWLRPGLRGLRPGLWRLRPGLWRPIRSWGKAQLFVLGNLGLSLRGTLKLGRKASVGLSIKSLCSGKRSHPQHILLRHDMCTRHQLFLLPKTTNVSKRAGGMDLIPTPDWACLPSAKGHQVPLRDSPLEAPCDRNKSQASEIQDRHQRTSSQAAQHSDENMCPRSTNICSMLMLKGSVPCYATAFVVDLSTL